MNLVDTIFTLMIFGVSVLILVSVFFSNKNK